jgi:dihydrofolate reductase
MRVVATEYLSLDGVFDEPGHWSGPYFDDDAATFKYDELMASDAMLLGRKTYEGFAAAWPAMEEETGDFGVRMNTMPKYVVTSTLEQLDWPGSQRISGDVVGAVRELAQQPGNDLLLAGSGQLFNALADADLIDLYRFMVHPIVLGSGPRLFSGENARRGLKLARTLAFGAGIVILEFERA